jgi:mRNA deadenylase 3'-5' endonuclease subunit Ccr4
MRVFFQEILHYSPSVACLQEVEEAHLPDLLGPMRAAGYEHRYKRRVGEGQTDGCATFWRTREWDLVSARYISPRHHLITSSPHHLTLSHLCPLLDIHRPAMHATCSLKRALLADTMK